MATVIYYSLMILIILSFGFLSDGQSVPAIYVFGDSLVDVGNNNYLTLSIAKANFPHNGVDFPTKKATGRFSNGKNSADFLAEKVGLPTSLPYLSVVSKSNQNASFLNGVSFASGGAGIFDGTDKQRRQSLTLTMQVDYYVKVYENLVQQLGSAAAQKHLSKSLVAVVIGSNDILGYFGSNQNTTPQQYVDLMVSSLKGLLKRMYDNGARKFVVPGIGPIGCCPSERVKNETEVCNEEANYWSLKYNEGLKSMLKELKSEHTDINYSYFDTYAVFHNLISNPASNGFSEVKSACCGLGTLKADVPCLPIATYCSNRRDHVFWDLYHPTEAVASIFADNIYDGPPEYTFPINVKHLIVL